MTKKREEQTDSIEGCIYELKLEIESLERDDTLRIVGKNIVEDMLIKRLASFADKSGNLINALEDKDAK